MKLIVTVITMKDTIPNPRYRSVVIVNGQIYQPILLFFRQKNLSLQVEFGYTRALVFFIEWLQSNWKSGLRNWELIQLFTNYYLFLRDFELNQNATIGKHCIPKSLRARSLLISRLNSFIGWMNSQDIAISSTATWENLIRAYYSLYHQAKNSMMKHLINTKPTSINHLPVLPFDNRIKKYEPTKAFPIKHFSSLLWQGFINPRAKINETRIWVKWNLRDILITILLGYGGKRISEPCHIWVNDINLDPKDNTKAIIFIADPEYGYYQIFDNQSNKEILISRKDYLHKYCNNRSSLHHLKGRQFSGWKGNILHNSELNAMRVFWIEPNAGRLFLLLWRIYRDHSRPNSSNTPYAFLTKDGRPVTPSIYTENLKNAINRINLVYNKKEGTTAHGFRHMYGQILSKLDLDRKTCQLMLGHKNALSQDVYKQQSLEDIEDLIKSKTKNNQTLHLSIPEEFGISLNAEFNNGGRE